MLLPTGRPPGWTYPPTSQVTLRQALDRGPGLVEKIGKHIEGNLRPFYQCMGSKHQREVLEAALAHRRPKAKEMDAEWKKAWLGLPAFCTATDWQFHINNSYATELAAQFDPDLPAIIADNFAADLANQPRFHVHLRGYRQAQVQLAHQALIERLAAATPAKSSSTHNSPQERAVRTLDAIWEGRTPGAPPHETAPQTIIQNLQQRRAAVTPDRRLSDAFRCLASAVKFRADICAHVPGTTLEAAPSAGHDVVINTAHARRSPDISVDHFVELQVALDYTLLRMQKNNVQNRLPLDARTRDGFRGMLFDINHGAVNAQMLWAMQRVLKMSSEDQMMVDIMTRNLTDPRDPNTAFQSVELNNEWADIVGLMECQAHLPLFEGEFLDEKSPSLISWLQKDAGNKADFFDRCSALSYGVRNDPVEPNNIPDIPWVTKEGTSDLMWRSIHRIGVSDDARVFLQSLSEPSSAGTSTGAGASRST
jgi:hypothetical protein